MPALSYAIESIEANQAQEFLDYATHFQRLNRRDSPAKRRDYYLSRKALQTSLAMQEQRYALNKLVVTSHQEIQGAEDFICSLSHCAQAGAAVVGHKSKYRALGIDIESNTRQIKAEAIRYFSHPEDEFSESLTHLEIWTIKEACFKAFSNYGLKGLLLKDIKCKLGKAYHNNQELKFELKKPQAFILAIAYVPVL